MPLFGETININLGPLVEIPPGRRIHIVVHHFRWQSIHVNIQIGIAEGHQGHAEHHGIGRSSRRSQRHHERTDIHAAERFFQTQFCESDFFGQRLEFEVGVWQAGDDLSVYGPAVAGETVHRPVALLVNDVLQRAAGFVIGPFGKPVALKRHPPPFLKRSFRRTIPKIGGPNLPHRIEYLLVEIRWKIGFFREVGVAADGRVGVAGVCQANCRGSHPK